jgi:nitrogen-specific signal transduction histidine kinase
LPPPQSLHVQGDAESLRQMVLNLTHNAIEAISQQRINQQGGGKSQITVALEAIEHHRVAIHVRDTGPGPTPAVAEQLFEPFVSGKPEGTGLGLYVARKIVENHHGAIYWQRKDAVTCFTVELPLI